MIISKSKEFIINDDQAMQKMGGLLAQTWAEDALLIFLNGDLGAGKTTLVRGFLRQLGYNGAVKSPTFTLVEPYTISFNNLKQLGIYHFDLYRLCDPEELEYMGMADYLDGQSMVFIEWPDKGFGYLPDADVVIDITHAGKQRKLQVSPNSLRGQNFFTRFNLMPW